MKSPTDQDTASSLKAYVPSDNEPWNLRRVVHLHRRAGFGATWAEIQRDLADGPLPSIDRVLQGTTRMDGVQPDFSNTSGSLAKTAIDRADATALKAWWVYRMLYSPDPLGERLALMWHNHFATSNAKVHDLSMILDQNEDMRRLARAEFAELLSRMMRDPALLIWLDAPLNQRGKPNENLARELMELFTLGVGNFSEGDVQEAARALTGWGPIDKFRQSLALYDYRPKKMFGVGLFTPLRSGHGQSLIDVLLAQPATADRLAGRLCDLFMGECTSNDSLPASLATGLQSHRLDIGWGIEAVLHSQVFFADENLGSRVSGPVEHVVSAGRALEMFDGSISTVELSQWATAMGQDLFYPPNVGGWQEGRAWLSPRTMIHRINFATELMNAARGRPFDAWRLAAKYGYATDEQTAIGFYCQLLLGRPATKAWLDRISADANGQRYSSAERLRRSVAVLLASPEAQLG